MIAKSDRVVFCQGILGKVEAGSSLGGQDRARWGPDRGYLDRSTTPENRIKSQLPGKDSNLHKERQKLLCYRYTTG